MAEKFSESSYQALIGHLFKRFPSFGSNGSSAYKPGLERELEFCRRLGNPQKSLRCIHVAGTNGKGSTCNMLAAHFASKGLRVGLYTSPHILDFRERMRVVAPSELISREEVWDFLTHWDSVFDEMELSLFEITTAMAFDFFARRVVDIAIVETGLGGRLDATNIITPELSVITNIGYDHMNLLGNTLAEIAGEKAGIIKPGVPVVIGESGEETDEVFLDVAVKQSSPIIFADKNTYKAACSAVTNIAGEAICDESAGITEPSFRNSPAVSQSSDGTGVKAILDRMDLRGSYQEKNLRTVFCALEVLGETPRIDAIENAAHICDFHGRWEKVSDNPVTICDIGHNAHGLKYNFQQLNNLLDSGEYSDLVMVYGSVSDKDVDAVLRLLPRRAHIFFSAADSPRALDAKELMARALATLDPATKSPDLWQNNHGNSEMATKCPDLWQNNQWKAVPTVSEAVKQATKLCATLPHPLLYIGGSTYIVSEALPIL